ncbi:iron-containing alcohol dehydrogenase, partial [Prauserella salsuginis]
MVVGVVVDGVGSGFGFEVVLLGVGLSVVDLDVIKDAPARFVRAGIGDAISNISAVADWELSHRLNGEPVDGLAAAMART